VPLFWLRTFYVEFRWSPDEVHLESRYIKYKYANSSRFQVDSRWTPDGYWSPAGVHLNSVGECKVLPPRVKGRGQQGKGQGKDFMTPNKPLTLLKGQGFFRGFSGVLISSTLHSPTEFRWTSAKLQ
jgi:hypothetical protein